MRHVTSLLTTYVRGKRKTLKYEFAVAAFAVWIAATLRIFLSLDPTWITAQGVNYATLTSTVFLFITAAVGIQAWQNTQPESGTTTTTTTQSAGYETGDIEHEPTPEERARGGQ